MIRNLQLCHQKIRDGTDIKDELNPIPLKYTSWTTPIWSYFLDKFSSLLEILFYLEIYFYLKKEKKMNKFLFNTLLSM